ncbi:MAG: HisA/HisF-related TIM barrel protein [Candidatus Omnitrophota bacterium]
MEIIPVLDIKNNQVVQAVKGERDRYRPFNDSVISSSTRPIEVVKSFIKNFDFKKFYIADLDSIEGNGDNFDSLVDLCSLKDIQVLSDIGIKDEDDLHKKPINLIDYLILGTETLESLEVLSCLMKIRDNNKIIISIDIKNDLMLARCKELSDPEEAIRILNGMGIMNFIVLDLNQVGSLGGPSNIIQHLITNLRKLHLNLIVGGGIQSVQDMVNLNELGVSGVLIGTAFHRGLIKKSDIDYLHRKTR